ncbi:MAG: ABC transporter ATP-binding protein/permease [Actinomycetota bacterium]|nr:ABC transporter ATP-binding protein/permease [Actinomycetota bacterium]
MTDSRRIAGVLKDFARGAGTRLTVLAVVTSLAAGAAAVSVSLWLKLIVDGAIDGDMTEVTVLAIALGVTVTVHASAASMSVLYLARLQFACGVQLVCRIMQAAGGSPGLEHYERPEYADRISLLKSQTNYISGFLPVLGDGLALAGRVAITAVLLAGVHPALLLLPLLALPSVWAGTRAERLVNAANVATAQQSRLETHLFGLSTTASPAKEVRVFGLGAELADRRRRAWDDVTDTVARAQLRSGLLRTAGWLPFAAGYLAAVGLALAHSGRGEATPGDVLLVMVLSGQVNGQVAQLLHVANRSATAVRVLGHLFWLEDHARDAIARTTPTEPAPVPDKLRHGIDLEAVSFRYGRDEVLHDVTLHLPAGSTVALVGENGAGKTSLVKLLCRFYEPTSGSITVDGVDLRRFDLAEWRRHLSGGFQDFARIELTLRESVGIGDIPSVDDPVAVGAALGRVDAKLPVGLEQQLGQQWLGGVDLSEGQWQKVAMARAMMRKQPLLLLLDEPTSGLDAHAEHALFELFAGVAAEAAARTGAIALFVSHRFSTVRMADQIVVLAGGRVVEQGDHGSLMRAGGLYRELYDIQARAYR